MNTMRVARSMRGRTAKTVSVPTAALERLLAAAEGVGGEYSGVHPVLRECREAALAVRKALQPIACCPRCSEPTPLISTIAFRQAEFYCLDCGGHFGFLSPKTGEPTPELEATLAQYEKEWEEHAGAKLSPEGHEPDDEEKRAAHDAARDWLRERIREG